MSRNFELLTQLETGFDVSDHRVHAAVSPSVLKTDAFSNDGTSFREETLRLVQRIFLSSNGSAPRQVVFCGVDGDNDSSSVCVSAAHVLAENTSQSVCLVDANLRSAQLPRTAGVETTVPSPAHRAPVREQCVQAGPHLWLAPTNLLVDEHGALLPAAELTRCLSELRRGFDYVLIDAPGSGVCGDAAVLAQIAGAAVLVVEANSTRRLTARKAKESLDAAGVNLLGTVLQNRTFPIPHGLYKNL